MTGDDDEEELRKALTLSLDETANGPKANTAAVSFGPSERSDPTQNWALVPVVPDPTQQSTTPQATNRDQQDQEDPELRRAVEASMNMDNYGGYGQDHIPSVEKWRGASTWE